MLGLQVPHDGHLLLEATARDDVLPLHDRALVFLLDGREVRRRSLLRPGRRLLDHVDMLLSLAPTVMSRAGRTDLIALQPNASPRAAIPPWSCLPSWIRRAALRAASNS